MRKTSLASKLKYMLVDPHYPNVAIEFNSDALRLAVVGVEKGMLFVQHLDSEKLPPGTLDISPFKPNINSLEAAAEALKSLWSRNRFKSSRICLLLQDRAALSFHLTMEHPAGNHQDCLELIRFKLKKNIPFRIEEAHINYFSPAGAPDYAATALWATVVNHGVLHQYEQFIQSSIDAECGLVDLATFNVMNLAHSEIKKGGLQEEDFLYVNLNRDYLSVAITQKGKLAFYRSRGLEGHNGVLEEAIAEIHPTTVFYVDKLSGEKMSRAFVYSVENADDLAARIESDLGLQSVILSIEPFSGTRFDAGNQNLLRSFTPLVGLLVSRKVGYQ